MEKQFTMIYQGINKILHLTYNIGTLNIYIVLFVNCVTYIVFIFRILFRKGILCL